MVNIRIKSFIALHLLFLFYSLALVVAKVASKFPFLSIKFLIYYGLEIIMIMVYAFFWQKIIKKFSLVVAFSNKGVVILWGLIWAFLFFGEKIRLNHLLGMIIIIIGIALVVKDDK